MPDSLNANPASSHTEEVKNVDIKIHDSLEGEKQVSNEREFFVDTESHLNENQASASLESSQSTTAIQDDAPKKSYASILSSQMKKGPTKIYVPTNASRMKTEKQSASLVAQAPLPEAPTPTAPNTAINESKNAQEEGISYCNSNLQISLAFASYICEKCL